ncbi:CZB domain-containing protein [Sulfurimonas sp.]
MTKSQSLEAIDHVRIAHLEQMDKIEVAVVYGQHVDNPTSVSKMKCDFGKWLYGEENSSIQTLLGAQFYEKLDLMHERWHNEYSKIYDMLFKEKKQGLFSTIFNKNKIDSLTMDKVTTYYVELQVITKELLNILDKSKRRMEALNESKYH